MVLPLILGALGGSLGTAGMLGGIGALGGAAIGSGLGGFAETGDIETGILTGLGAFAGGALLGPLMGGAGGAAGGAGGASGAGAAGAAAPSVAAAPAAAASTATRGGFGSLFSGAAPGSTASILGTATPGAGITGIGKGALNFAQSGAGIGSTVGGAMGASFATPGGGDDEKSKSKYADTPGPSLYKSPTFPGPGGSPGSSEYDYGVGGLPTVDQIMDYRTTGTRPTGYYGGGMIRSLENTFGPIRLAEGGIATLMQDEPPPSGGNEKDVVNEAVRAIKGESPNPEIALATFLTAYGEDALRDLVDKVESGEMDETAAMSEGQLRGPGDGMDDLIPATIEGEQDVLLSDGEFIVPADVVSGLGNGSSDAGARALEEMMDRVRTSRNGSSEQPPQVPQEEVMPA
jgi:hypothetical protein